MAARNNTELHCVPSQLVINNPIMAIQNLSWGPTPATCILHNINFEVQQNQMLGIVGANGAGKSSLLRCLYRVYQPECGSVSLLGENIWQIAPQQFAQKVAVVLQESPAEFSLTVKQIIEMGRTPYHQLFSGNSAADTKIIAQVIEQLSLQSLIERPFSQLSGGEKQRVYLARALVQQPTVLILDEPTNHLDIRHQLEIMQLIAELGITVIITLHDLNIASAYCDQILLLHEGAVLAHDCVDKVLTPEIIQQAYGVDCHITTHAAHSARVFQFSLATEHSGLAN